MKISRKTGTTSEILQVFIRSSASTSGDGLTGLTNSSSGLTAYYCRNDQSTATVISLVSMTAGTFTSGGFVVMDGTNMPGWYQFCPPDAVFTSGRSAAIHLKGAANMAALPIEIELTAWNNQDATAGGMSRLDTTVSSRLASASAPTNFAVLSIDAAGAISRVLTAGTVSSVLLADRTTTAGTVSNVITASTVSNVILTDRTTTAGTVSSVLLTDRATTAGTVSTVLADTAKMTESYAANTVTPTPHEALMGIHQMLMGFAIAGTTITVRKLDNSSVAFAVTLDDGTNPTSATRP